MVYKLSVELGKEQSKRRETGVQLDDLDEAPWLSELGGLVPLLVAYEVGASQGCAKTWVFHQKPSPVGLTGLNRVLMGFMGQTRENSDNLCRFRFEDPNLENQEIILHKMDN